jgi:uncharacterized protein YacL
VILSGVFAVIGNVIGFSLIGKAGPVTFQVVGHVKTMLTFIFGLLMFPERSETTEQLRKKILGLVVSMAGVILYTVFEMQIKGKEEDAAKRLLILKKEEQEKEKEREENGMDGETTEL